LSRVLVRSAAGASESRPHLKTRVVSLTHPRTGMLRRVVRELTTAGCPAWRASCSARALGSDRAFGSSPSASSSEELPIAFEPRVDTYTEQRRAWNEALNAQRKEWAADFEAKANARVAEVQSERARIEEEKVRRKAAKALKSAARAKEVVREEKQRVRAKETVLRRKAVVRAQRDFVAHLRKTAREEELLKASRNWVTKEDLDERIRHALENPRPMY